MRALTITAALIASSIAPALAAPQVALRVTDGRVWLSARDATVAQVFEEWARVGHTRIVNAETIAGRLTLELTGVPEEQALDLLLRSAAGFVAMPRMDAGQTVSRSQFESIFIMAARQPIVRAASASAPVFQPPPVQPALGQMIAPGVQRILGADGQPVPDDQEDAPPQDARPRSALPPGFAAPPQTAPPAPATGEPAPIGSAVPGMIVAPPVSTTPQPRRPPR
jgi:hypothetical protein